jgi:hypothetical protein
MDHSSPLTKQWFSFHEVPLGYGETFAKSEAWWISFLDEEVVMLSLFKAIINLFMEGLDPFNQSSCMIYLSVGLICR